MDQEFPLLPLPLTQRLSVRQWTMVDIVAAGLLAVGGFVATVTSFDGTPRQDSAWQVLAILLIASACVALPYRRLHPRPVLVVVAPAVIGLVLIRSRGPMMLALVLAIYTVASVSPPQASLRAAAMVIVGVVIVSVVATGSPSLVAPPLILVGWLAGENTRTRRAYIAGVTAWAAERDRQREERSRRAVADERLRIARELHDVVAHTMSVVAVRSSVARVVLETQPEEVTRALEIIEAASRRALHEMRLLVGVLRDGDTVRDLAPAPGLADLPQLVAEIAAAGVPVEVHIDGQPRPLPAGIDVSAFRIVQEALTNVVRHARPAQARLDLRYRPDELLIEVTDDGGGRARPVVYPHYPAAAAAVLEPAPAMAPAWGPPGPPPASAPPAGPASAPSYGATPAGGPTPAPSPAVWTSTDGGSPASTNGGGHGLIGMRERVALFGGTFSSGPLGSGYRVTAVLPTDERSPARP
ncbi:MAG: histidine kinase [Actinomycetota bacterium]|nr:histidine kinase [Actinomycetota bacterium]